MKVQTVSAKAAKYGFGKLIDAARAQPVVVEKYGRPVVVVLSYEEFQKLKSGSAQQRKALLQTRSDSQKI